MLHYPAVMFRICNLPVSREPVMILGRYLLLGEVKAAHQNLEN